MRDDVNLDEIKESAKHIMDQFATQLDTLGDADETFGKDREHMIRQTMPTHKDDHAFISRFFKNAPRKSGQFIVVDKK